MNEETKKLLVTIEELTKQRREALEDLVRLLESVPSYYVFKELRAKYHHLIKP